MISKYIVLEMIHSSTFVQKPLQKLFPWGKNSVRSQKQNNFKEHRLDHLILVYESHCPAQTVVTNMHPLRALPLRSSRSKKVPKGLIKIDVNG